MKCPGCGYLSFDLLESCAKCGAPMVATAGLAWAKPGDSSDYSLCRRPEAEVSLDFATGLFPHDVPADEEDGVPDFSLDENLFGGGAPAVAAESDAADLPGPTFSLSDEDPGFETVGVPIIDRDEEVPEYFWAPEVASFSRRGLALLVDQVLLAAILGLFFLGAFLALGQAGFDTELFLAASGLRAALLPFALLAALLSLGYHAFFHGTTGCTPGKALAGVEVRTCDGGDLTWSRVILRWFCGVLCLASAGAGLVWAVFEPRRRDWADLLSGTIIARQSREAIEEVSRR